MDFGGLDSGGGGVICSDNTSSTMFVASAETKQKWYGSGGFNKHERSSVTEDEWNKESKLAKTSDDFSSSKATMMFQQLPISHENQQMLSFSTPNSQNHVTMPYYNQHPTSAFARNTSGTLKDDKDPNFIVFVGFLVLESRFVFGCWNKSMLF